jgi:hypothetical protein
LTAEMKILDMLHFLTITQEGRRPALYSLCDQLYLACLYTKPADGRHCISMSYFPNLPSLWAHCKRSDKSSRSERNFQETLMSSGSTFLEI